MLTNTEQVIEFLGGLDAVAKLTGRNKDAAWNWFRKPNFPADTYRIMTHALAQRGESAPHSLWRQK